MSTLLELPAEIACQIAWFLSANSICVLRQTCRALNKITWPVFCDLFECSNVMMQYQSLETLKNVSQHNTLKYAVKTLRICTQCIPDHSSFELERICERLHPVNNSAPLLEDRMVESTCTSCRLRKLLEEQQKFRLLDEDCHHLAQAMVNLPNCRTLVLSDVHRPWGASQLEAEIGCKLAQDISFDGLRHQPFWRYTLDSMLVAAAESKIPLEKLEIYLGHRDELDAFAPTIVSTLDQPGKRDKMCSPPFEFLCLTSLHMVISPDFVDESEPDWRLGVCRFFAMFPQLSHLTMAFDGEDQYDEGNLFPHLSTILNIPCLQVVELAGLETTETELMTLLLRHEATLEDITLREVKLPMWESWPSLLEKLWCMSGVRCVTLDDCLMDYNFMADVYSDLPRVASITDEQTLARVSMLTRKACETISEAYTPEE